MKNRQTTKRVLALLLALMLALAAFPATLAEGAEDGAAGEAELAVQSGVVAEPETPPEEPVEEEPAGDAETPVEEPETPVDGGETPKTPEEGGEAPAGEGTEPETPVEEPVEEPAETVPCTKTEGCTLADGHEGDCVPAEEEPEPEEEAPATLPEQLAALSEAGGELRYDEDFTLDADLTIPAGVALTLAGKLTVPFGFTLTNAGTLTLAGVTDIYGALVNAENAQLTIQTNAEKYPDAAAALTLFAEGGQAAAFTNAGTVTLFGTLAVQEGATLTGASNITLSEGAAITGKTDLSEEEPAVTLPYGFAGMPEGYALSAAQMEQKAQLVAHNMVSQTAALTPGADYVENQILFETDTQEEAELIAAAYSATLLLYAEGVAMAALTTATTLEAVTAAADPNIPLPAVSPNHTVTLGPEVDEPLADAEPQVSAFSLLAPQKTAWDDYKDGDPLLTNPSADNYQWAHDMVNSYEAWGVTQGSSNVTVAVLDTGALNSHEDLAGHTVIAEMADVLKVFDEDGNVIDQYYDTDANGIGLDTFGHGTHVAGIIGATRGNGKGGSGIAPGVNIVSYRVLPMAGGSGRNIWIRFGITRAADRGVDIINLSLGGAGYSPLIQSAINYAVERGVTVIAAMGNDGSNTVCYPAAYDNVIAVAAVNRDGNRAIFSNYGAWADVAAPGVDIWSTYKNSSSSYGSMDGTSQATPVVAGVAALYMSKVGNPGPAAMEKKLKACVNKSGSSQIGAGIVDASKLFATDKAKPEIIILDAKSNRITNFKLAVPYDATLTFAAAAGNGNDEMIVYTLDGTTPTVRDGYVTVGEEYTDPIDLADGLTAGASCTVKAMCISGMGVPGAVASLSFKLAEQPSATGVTVARNGTFAEEADRLKLKAGETASFTATVAPEGARTDVTWSVVEKTNVDSAVINAAGELVTKRINPSTLAGTIKIRATSASNPGVYGEFTLTVPADVKLKIQSVNLTPTSVKLSYTDAKTPCNTQLAIGKLIDVEGNVVTADAAEYVKAWTSSNTKVATVDASGLVTGVGKGTATITCKLLDGSNKYAKSIVTVEQLVTEIVVSGQRSIAPGRSATYKAAVMPSNANNKGYTWAIAPEMPGVSITSRGVVKVEAEVAEDTLFTVTATAKDVGGADASYEVKAAPLAKSVTIEPATAAKLAIGETLALTGTVWLDDAREMQSDIPPLWTSSKTSVATVDAAGVVTASATNTGTAVITAAAQDGSGKKATVTVTVVRPVEAFAVTGASYIAAGKSVTYKAAEFLPANATDRSVIWSLSLERDDGVAINARGVLTVPRNYEYEANDTVTVVATAKDGSGVTADRLVTIQPLAASVLVTGEDDPRATKNQTSGAITALKLDIGESFDLSSSVLFADGGAYPVATSWKSSSIKVATVSAGEGGETTVTAVGKGRSTVTCAAMDASGRKATVTVTVVEAVESFEITGQRYIYPGKSATYKAAAFLPASATEKSVVWSVQNKATGLTPTGVSINARGALTVKANADVQPDDVLTVVATAADKGGAISTFEVEVVNYLTTSLRFYTEDQQAYSYPDPRQENNSRTGLMTGATIYTVDVQGSQWDSSYTDLEESWIQLGCSAEGTFANEMLWTSSNPKVATIDPETSVVQAHAAGKTTITCAAQDGSGKKASVTITVIVPNSYLTVTSKAPQMTYWDPLVGVGKSVGNTLAYGDTYGAPTNKKIVWECQVYSEYRVIATRAYERQELDSFLTRRIVTLSSSGTLAVNRAMNNCWGETIGGYEWSEVEEVNLYAVVTATTTDGTALISNPITYIVTGLTTKMTAIDKSITLPIQNDEGYLRFTADSWYSDFTVTSSNPKVACYAGNNYDGVYVEYGYLCIPIATGLNPGTATITAKANDGSGKSCSFTVKVVRPVTSITITGANTIAPGRYATYKANVLPTNASNKSVAWYSYGELPDGVTLSTTGRVTVGRNVASGTRFTICAYSKCPASYYIYGSKTVVVG